MPDELSSTATYFVTSATFGRRRLFQAEANARLFLETLQHYRRAGHYRLHAFVVMPDHIHLLITPCGITIERAVGLIKGGFSHRMGSKVPVWQKGFHERRMRDAEEFIARRVHSPESCAGAIGGHGGGLSVFVGIPHPSRSG